MSEMAKCSDELLRRSFEVNFFAHQYVAQGRRPGFLSVRASEEHFFLMLRKSAFNPGPGFRALLLSQKARGHRPSCGKYAIELGKIGVRVECRQRPTRVQTHLFGRRAFWRAGPRRAASRSKNTSKATFLGQEVFGRRRRPSLRFSGVGPKKNHRGGAAGRWRERRRFPTLMDCTHP